MGGRGGKSERRVWDTQRPTYSCAGPMYAHKEVYTVELCGLSLTMVDMPTEHTARVPAHISNLQSPHHAFTKVPSPNASLAVEHCLGGTVYLSIWMHCIDQRTLGISRPA